MPDPTTPTSPASTPTPATATVPLTTTELAMLRGGLEMKIGHHHRMAIDANLIQTARDQHASRVSDFKALDAKLAAVSPAPAAP